MNIVTFRDLQSQIFHLHQSGQYEQAFKLATKEADHFPHYFHHIAYWRLCLASRLKETTQAIDILEEVLSVGDWFSEEQLRNDPDLQPMQKLPIFLAMVEICRLRHQEAQARATPLLITQSPDFQTGPVPLLLALHGNQGNAQTSIEHWQTITQKGWLLALPQSSQIFSPDAYTWHDRPQAVKEIQEHYRKLCKQYAVDLERVVIAGFSLGGALAIWMALTGALPVQGFIAVSPSIREVEQWLPTEQLNYRDSLRGYIVIGEQDPCYNGVQNVATRLSSLNIVHELEVHSNLKHDFPPDFSYSLACAAKFLLQANNV